MTAAVLQEAQFPRMRYSGDAAVLVEFGDEMDLRYSFMAIARKKRIEDARIPGILEVTQGLTSLLVQFDPGQMSPERMIGVLTSFVGDTVDDSNDTVVSRLIEIPVLYRDPWTRECIEDYRRRIGPVVDNLQTVAEASGLSTSEDVIRHHSGTQYWVAGLGTWPGLPFNFPVDPGYCLRAPKYNPARTWTPEGSIGLGGSCTSIYSIESPGGYQLLGRTPVPIWRTQSMRPWSHDGPALFQAGDRVSFVPIERRDYDEIHDRVEEGSYRASIRPAEPVHLADFRAHGTQGEGVESL